MIEADEHHSRAAPRGRVRIFRQIFHWAAKYRGAVELGWYDFVTVYRRSFFGAMWPLIQLSLWIATITFVFHEALGNDVGSYILYVGIGFFGWEFIQSAFQAGPSHFSSQGGLIKNVPTDISKITVRRVSCLVFRSLLQAPVPIILVAIFGDGFSLHAWILIPVVMILITNLYSLLTVFGILGVYFKDFEFFVPTVVRFLFFVTPIIWSGDVGLRKMLSTYNPLAYFLELIRAPLNGETGTAMAWGVVVSITVIGFAIALVAQSAFRHQIAYRV